MILLLVGGIGSGVLVLGCGVVVSVCVVVWIWLMGCSVVWLSR